MHILVHTEGEAAITIIIIIIKVVVNTGANLPEAIRDYRIIESAAEAADKSNRHIRIWACSDTRWWDRKSVV